MGKPKGSKDSITTKSKKSEAASARWAAKRKQQLDINAPTIETAISYLQKQADIVGMDLIDFIETYVNTIINTTTRKIYE